MEGGYEQVAIAEGVVRFTVPAVGPARAWWRRLVTALVGRGSERRSARAARFTVARGRIETPGLALARDAATRIETRPGRRRGDLTVLLGVRRGPEWWTLAGGLRPATAEGLCADVRRVFEGATWNAGAARAGGPV